MFSKFDLQSGYHQLKIKSSATSKLTFQARYGHFEFIVMAFGIANALVVLMDLMYRVFHKFLD